MTTSIGQRGQVVIPKAIRNQKRIQAGDDFEVLTDEDDADLILLRRVRPAANAGLVAHLAACPLRGAFPRVARPPEAMRRVKV